jgi:hypothetical protein
VDGIEILPLKDVTSLPQPLPICAGKNTSYPLTSEIAANPFKLWLHNQGLLALRGLTNAGTWLLTPQDAYAIDAGGGGEALSFSTFGIVLPPEPTAEVIDFEHLPDGTASCTRCELTDQFATRGVTFSFTPVREDGSTTATLAQSSVDPAHSTTNHDVESAFIPDDGWWTGTINMAFASHPTSVTFTVRLNNAAVGYQITARDASGEPLSSESISRTSSTYPGCGGTCTFRQEIVTVTNEGGISAIYANGGSATLFIDDMTIRPAPHTTTPTP